MKQLEMEWEEKLCLASEKSKLLAAQFFILVRNLEGAQDVVNTLDGYSGTEKKVQLFVGEYSIKTYRNLMNPSILLSFCNHFEELLNGAKIVEIR